MKQITMPRFHAAWFLLAPFFVLMLAAGFPNERDANDAFCAQVGGQREVRHVYDHPTGSAYVVVDCETEERVYEGGLDKRSSLDSV